MGEEHFGRGEVGLALGMLSCKHLLDTQGRLSRQMVSEFRGED